MNTKRMQHLFRLEIILAIFQSIKSLKKANISCHQQYEHNRKRLTDALGFQQLMCLWELAAMRKHEHNYKRK